MGCCCSKDSAGDVDEKLMDHEKSIVMVTIPQTRPLQTETSWMIPATAVVAQCHRVTNGDSLIILGDQPIKLLGVDAPDVKGRQPFAAEAKAKCESLVPRGATIWLDFEANHTVDEAGRKQCYVYVRPEGRAANQAQDEGVLVNYEMLREGFARFHPLPQSRLKHEGALTGAVAQARQESRGIWATFIPKEEVLVVVKTKEYHLNPTCSRIPFDAVASLKRINENKALDQGMFICPECGGMNSSLKGTSASSPVPY